MAEKITGTRFTIQFSRTDPSHLQVAEILNRQGRRSKAQYIVNAVLHYENCDEAPNMQRTANFDVKVIEAVVNRILLDRERNSVISTSEVVTGKQDKNPAPTTEEFSFDDALEVLGEGGFNTIADTLDLFRRK